MKCNNPLCENDAKLKYCSQSCAAKVSNANRAKPKGNCTYCTKPLTGSAIKFCNTSCQRTLERDQAIKLWLETGQAVPGSSPTHYVRVHILAEQKGKCNLCPTTTVWQGKELRFVLDHIDGNCENNHRDNLRLVCPNCDSQLDTYKSKNKGNGRHARRVRYANGQSY